jgi:pimeloyl-ACP methyl ester carboxylesterase
MVNEFRNGELVFDVRDEGPADGEVVILLHGFPQTNVCWDGVIPGLASAGFRVLAPNQRGYSRRARPTGRRAFAANELVGDVLALADAAGAERFHLVGHDWGGALAWYCAMWHPDRLRTVTSLATPHPAAFRKALLSSSQILRSWYFLLFQLPRLPELMATSPRSRPRFRKALLQSGLPEAKLDEYLTTFDDPGAATCIFNWYRGVPFTPPSQLSESVTVPTLYVYGARDVALGPRAADLTGRYVTGPYRYERLDATHWMPEELPDVVTRLILEHIGSGDQASAAS